MTAKSKPKPNIVLIMIESWDGRVIGCLGDPALTRVTPNVDKLAKRGVMFKNMYTTHPICCPARANLWSGMFTFHCKSWNNHKGLEPGTRILKDVLEEKANYRFASKRKIGIGKHDYLSGGHSNQNRITAWTGAANIRLPSYLQKPPVVQENDKKELHVIDWVDVKRAKKFLKKERKRQNKQKKKRENGSNADPFFLYLSLRAPHPRFRTNRRWLAQVNMDAVRAPPADETVHPVIEYQLIQKDWKYGFKPEYDPDYIKRTRAIYYAMVAETDAMIGEIVDEIDALGLNEDTIIILVADHGENNMEHELFYKMNMYESSSRVPLIIAGPGIQKGVLLDTLVTTTDIYPTIMDMAGIPLSDAPNPLDGESLLPLLVGETTESRNTAFSMYTGTAANTSMFMLRKDEWKYIAYPGYDPQLFNLKEDPDEIHDQAHNHPEIVKEMDAALREIVDYPQVHKEWQAYCRKSFKEYRERVRAKPIPLFEYGAKKPRATYEDVIANTYKGWTEEHARQLEDWLNRDE